MFDIKHKYYNSQTLKKCLTIIFIVSNAFRVFSQNLIPNPSFEELICCYSNSPNNSCSPLLSFSCQRWGISNTYGATNGVVLNSCDTSTPNGGNLFRGFGSPLNSYGSQQPHSGNGYAGMYCRSSDPHNNEYNRREFLRNKIKSNLVNSAVYDLELYTSLADNYNYACNNMQALFSDTVPSFTIVGFTLTNLTVYQPQAVFSNYQLNNKTSWQKITTRYLAKGNEQYITIGNFVADENTDYYPVLGGFPDLTWNFNWDYAYYYFDDVSLTLGIDAGKDTVICANDTNTIQLKASAGWQHYTWQTTAGVTFGNTRVIRINTPGTYIVKGTVDSLPNYSKIDTVVVGAYNIAPALFAAHAPNDTTVCVNTSVTLNIINSSNTLSYWWQPKSSNSPSITVNDSGLYTVRIYSGTCYKTDSITVSYYSNQQSLLDSNTIHINNLNNNITANSGFTNYEWRDENNELIATTQSTSYTPVIAANAAISIFISAINAEGCLIKDTLQVIYNELPIIIQNPQIIGKGGAFKILNLPPNSNAILHDAMGQIVFEQNNYTNNFNLDFIAEGFYFYKIVLPDGIIINGKLLILEK